MFCGVGLIEGGELTCTLPALTCSVHIYRLIAPEKDGIGDKCIINDQPLRAFDPFISN